MQVRPMLKQDIEATVLVHLRSFKGYMNASLGKNYLRRFLNWFRISNIGTALVLTDGKRVVGYVVGATLGYDAELNKVLIKTGIWAILTHPNILFHTHFTETIKSRLKLLLGKKKVSIKVNKEPTGTGISLVGIAVDPQHVKKGGGTLLMQVFEHQAKQAGYSYMRLSVYIVNEKAKQLYTKNGWKLLEIDGPISYYYKEISK
jgi:ribosomal protein S18 acetylase RimI-like enzyme